MGKHANSIDSKILSRVQSHGKGWVFTPAHFDDLAGRATVSIVLKRHTDAGTIRNVARGLYDYPKTDPQLGLLQPSVDDIANALAGRDEIRLQPSGAVSTRMLRPSLPHRSFCDFNRSASRSASFFVLNITRDLLPVGE
jgi:hypothetical protein